MTDSEAFVSVCNLTKSYGGAPAVSGFSIDIAKGEKVAVIGPNGAGKSTLFGVIAGEHRPSRGQILLAGRNVTGWPPSRLCRQGVSRTFQVARFFATMSVRDNMVMAAMVGRRKRVAPWNAFTNYDDEVLARVERVLARTSLSHRADQCAGTLAQGARKTLELAMAIVQEPVLLLLDEPTAGMSLDDSLSTIESLRDICQGQPNLTVIITAHDMDVVFALASRVVLMARGQIVLDGSPDHVAGQSITHEIYLGKKHD